MSAVLDVDRLVPVLSDLMQGAGGTAGRAAACAELRQLESVTGTPADTVGDRVLDALYTAATDTADTLGHKGMPAREVLLAALALGEYRTSAGGLHARLTAAGKNFKVPIGTMLTYKRAVLPTFAQRLLELKPDQVVPRPRHEDDTATGVVIRETRAEIRWVYSGRIPILQSTTRTVVADTQPIYYYRTYFTYPNDSTQNAIRIQPVANCAVRAFRVQGTGQHLIELRLPHTRPGETVTFSYLIEVASTAQDRPYLRHLTRYPGAEANVSIQFDPQELPTKVYSFEQRGTDFDPCTPDPDRALVPNELGTVEASFSQKLQTYFGFGWEW